MEIRPMTAADLPAVLEIDATIESAEHLHIHREGEDLSYVWKMEKRRLREPRTHRHILDDETTFALRQIAGGVEEGIALVAEHDQSIAAAAAARPDAAAGIFRLVDLRVDIDYRRQGLASGLVFQIIQEANQRDFRAVAAIAASDDFPAIELLIKLNFELAGFDSHFKSNHDLLKDSVSLFWYLQLK